MEAVRRKRFVVVGGGGTTERVASIESISLGRFLLALRGLVREEGWARIVTEGVAIWEA